MVRGHGGEGGQPIIIVESELSRSGLEPGLFPGEDKKAG